MKTFTSGGKFDIQNELFIHKSFHIDHAVQNRLFQIPKERFIGILNLNHKFCRQRQCKFISVNLFPRR